MHAQLLLAEAVAAGGGGTTLRTGLVSWYDFTDATGSTHVDSTGANTLSNAATNGGGYVVIAGGTSLTNVTPTGLDFVSGDFTMACWVNASAANLGCISRFPTGSANRIWSLLIEGGVSKFAVSTDGATFTVAVDGATVNNSAWHLLIGWRSTTDGKIYVQVDNATPVGVTFSAGATLYSNPAVPVWVGDLGFGVYNSGGNFKPTGGWSRELTGAERTTLWNGGAGVNYAAL